MIYRLSAVSIIDLIGPDAMAIAQNLTTNDLKSLAPAVGCETFVTDVRGKTLGHFIVFRTDRGLRFLGAPGQSQAFANHADRYTIREDATPEVLDEKWAGIVVAPEGAKHSEFRVEGAAEPDRYHVGAWDAADGEIADSVVGVYQVPWLGEGTLLLLAEMLRVEPVLEALASALGGGEDPPIGGDTEFQHRRTLAGFPWYGGDLDASHLPQEASRDAEAICFTKGCYLGQETVARLDALGQVQKKLVRWAIEPVATAGSQLSADGKTVGRLTSVADLGDGRGIAIGFARRSHFDPGATAEGRDAESGEPFRGTVVDPRQA